MFFALLLWFGIALLIGSAAAARGRSSVGWFLLSVVLSPLIAGILLIAFPVVETRGAMRSQGKITCPFCAEPIRREAKLCPHCRSTLPVLTRPASPMLSQRAFILLIFFAILAGGALLHKLHPDDSLAPAVQSDADSNAASKQMLNTTMVTATIAAETPPAEKPNTEPQAKQDASGYLAPGELRKKNEETKVTNVAPQQSAEAKAANISYVVQVATKQGQTEALSAFVDMQHKYPSLLAGYRPLTQKADLGSLGVWYRLRIGPINDKTAAMRLCSELKSQGLPDCQVMANR